MVGTKVDKTLSGRVAGGRYKRPNFPVEFKRELVEQTLEPGASVALIARQSDVNANLLFKWRRLYLAGAYGPPSVVEQRNPEPDSTASLLPVSVIAEMPVPAVNAPIREATPGPENSCEVEFDRALLRIRGDVPAAVLRLLIRELSR
ncbi:IS66-like element accessory protein TnpA [Cupriavidus sp. D39]|uniref:IS66-like element accessory protein TnpA n=1 Tax=Cupriavidus sp. D39 TaxID=2997877 RepID=UPI00226DA9CB|nr:transposase [Cupriavidus sp. D39]MCY0854161.1 transposase [Cupriavidus sp. D39]